MLGLLTFWKRPHGWFDLIAYGTVYSTFYLATWFAMFDADHLRNLRPGLLWSKVGLLKARFASAKS